MARFDMFSWLRHKEGERAARSRQRREEEARQAAEERAAQERAAQERAAEERAAQERAAQERAAQERAALERAAQEKARATASPASPNGHAATTARSQATSQNQNAPQAGAVEPRTHAALFTTRQPVSGPLPSLAPAPAPHVHGNTPATTEAQTSTQAPKAEARPENIGFTTTETTAPAAPLMPLNEQKRVVFAMAKVRKEPKPSPGMPAFELAPPKLRKARVIAVKAGGRQLLARVSGAERTYTYALRKDGTYRLAGAPPKTAPRLLLGLDAPPRL